MSGKNIEYNNDSTIYNGRWTSNIFTMVSWIDGTKFTVYIIKKIYEGSAWINKPMNGGSPSDTDNEILYKQFTCFIFFLYMWLPMTMPELEFSESLFTTPPFVVI